MVSQFPHCLRAAVASIRFALTRSPHCAHTSHHQDALAKANSVAGQILSLIRVVRSHGSEERELHRCVSHACICIHLHVHPSPLLFFFCCLSFFLLFLSSPQLLVLRRHVTAGTAWSCATRSTCWRRTTWATASTAPSSASSRPSSRYARPPDLHIHTQSPKTKALSPKGKEDCFVYTHTHTCWVQPLKSK